MTKEARSTNDQAPMTNDPMTNSADRPLSFRPHASNP
jgi:hypothetical protein